MMHGPIRIRFTNFIFENLNPKSRCLWDNVEKYCTAGEATDDLKIERMRFARWVIKATDTHPEFVTLIAFPRQ